MDTRINYSFSDTPFGKVIAASTKKGVCYLHFEDDERAALLGLQEKFPTAELVEGVDDFQLNALSVICDESRCQSELKLDLIGTPFQLKVWECLMGIPFGSVTTYGDIARSIGKPTSSRAVGSAVGRNPVAFLVPCHRVIKGSGELGGYMWGQDRKSAIIDWEAAQRSQPCQ